MFAFTGNPGKIIFSIRSYSVRLKAIFSEVDKKALKFSPVGHQSPVYSEHYCLAGWSSPSSDFPFDDGLRISSTIFK